MNDDLQAAWIRNATPNEHHARLAILAGRWHAAAQFWMAPDQPPINSDGQCVNTPILGARWISMHYTCDFMGSPYEGTGVIGFDNITGEYVGNWMDSMSTQMQLHRGKPGPDPARIEMRGKAIDAMGVEGVSRNVTTIHAPDHHTYEMFRACPGQPEFRTGLIEYRRIR